MGRPRIDLTTKIREILAHSDPLPPESATPLAHYWRSTADIYNLLQYVGRNLADPSLYATVRDGHVRHLNSMALVNYIEAFERFLKETAACCVDILAAFVLDDRFDEFRIQGSSLAAHFNSDTLGRALCESATWLECKQVNDRFRKLLADPFEPGDFQLFRRTPRSEEERYNTLRLIWQLRHSVVHNVGVITQSDAIKLRLMAKQAVSSPRVLRPTRDDLRYLKRFLDEVAELSNKRVGTRLAELLTQIHADDPTLFDAHVVANELARLFGFKLSVAGVNGA
jgi:hypothetical protein